MITTTTSTDLHKSDHIVSVVLVGDVSGQDLPARAKKEHHAGAQATAWCCAVHYCCLLCTTVVCGVLFLCAVYYCCVRCAAVLCCVLLFCYSVVLFSGVFYCSMVLLSGAME